MYSTEPIAVETVEIPKSNAGRPVAHNPLSTIVGAVKDVRDKASRFTVALHDSDTDKQNKIVAAIKRDLTRAGAEHGVQVRRTVDLHQAAKMITVVFWCVDKPLPKPAKTETPTK